MWALGPHSCGSTADKRLEEFGIWCLRLIATVIVDGNVFCRRSHRMGLWLKGTGAMTGPREDDSRDGDDKEEDRKGVATTAVVLERVL